MFLNVVNVCYKFDDCKFIPTIKEVMLLTSPLNHYACGTMISLMFAPYVEGYTSSTDPS